MSRIHVGRYAQPEAVGYQGWIAPQHEGKTPPWILFVDLDGRVHIYLP